MAASPSSSSSTACEPACGAVSGAVRSPAIQRQAIVDDKRAVIGYELFEVPAASDGADATLFNALADLSGEAPASRRIVVVRCTVEQIASGYLDLLNPGRVVLEIPLQPNRAAGDEVARQRALLARARQAGFRLVFDPALLRPEFASWLPLANFVQLDMRALTPERAEQIIREVRARCKAVVVARHITSDAQYSRLKLAGAKLFQGYWFAEPAPVDSRSKVQPAQSTVLHLLSLVRREAEVGEIEEVLKRDPTLSFNLLRFINSCGFGLNAEITSFGHAVMILGLNKLFRWATLLMTAAPAAGVAPAAGNLAVVRGRLMELLAAELMLAERCDDAFIVGVFSMLETLTGIPLPEALAVLDLSTAVNDALLRNEGEYAPFLALVKCCESSDEAAFEEAAQLLQLSSHQVNCAHLQALAWADHLEG